MIGLTRIYCYQGDEFQLVDVPTQDATNEVSELKNEGWEVEAAIPV